MNDEATFLSATLLSKKKPQPFGCGHYVGITDLSRVGQRIVLAKKVSSGHFPPELQMEQKETATFRLRSLCWRYLSSRAVARQVLSALMSLTSVFGMGTGGPSSQSTPTRMDGVCPIFYINALRAFW